MVHRTEGQFHETLPARPSSRGETENSHLLRMSEDSRKTSGSFMTPASRKAFSSRPSSSSVATFFLVSEDRSSHACRFDGSRMLETDLK